MTFLSVVEQARKTLLFTQILFLAKYFNFIRACHLGALELLQKPPQ